MVDHTHFACQTGSLSLASHREGDTGLPGATPVTPQCPHGYLTPRGLPSVRIAWMNKVPPQEENKTFSSLARGYSWGWGCGGHTPRVIGSKRGAPCRARLMARRREPG